LSAYM